MLPLTVTKDLVRISLYPLMTYHLKEVSLPKTSCTQYSIRFKPQNTLQFLYLQTFFSDIHPVKVIIT